MKKSSPSFLSCFTLAALAVCAASPVWAAKPPDYASSAMTGGSYALVSGDYHSRIWERVPEGEKNKGKVNTNLPPPTEQACIGRAGVTVTVSKPCTLTSWLHRALDGTTVWKKGGSMYLSGSFYGVRGAKAVGTFSMLDGGALTVNAGFMLSGQTFIDSSTGVFDQKGGDVTINGSFLGLTGPYILSNSTGAVGIYNLSGGNLNIVSERVRTFCGIINGVGKGTFNWTGGVLNATFLSEDLVNNGGQFNPGGREKIGETKLESEQARTYTQKKKGSLGIDIAGTSKFDRIIWTDKSKNSAFVFEDGALIEPNLLGGHKPTPNRGFAVVTADKIRVEGDLEIAGSFAKDFSWEIEERKGQQVLRLVYTPGKGGGKLEGK